LLILPPSESAAAPNKEQYELQERCGRRAAEIWRDEYVGGRSHDKGAILTYESHYSPSLNMCFFLEKVRRYDNGKEVTIRRLFDANGGDKEYAMFLQEKQLKPSSGIAPFVVVCFVSEIKCHSEDEWQALLKKHYLED